MVAKPPCDDRVMHHGLVVLVLEVAVPAGAELWARPTVHHLEFFLGGSDLDTGLDTVRGERASAVDIPLLEDALLDGWVTTSEVIKRLDVGLRAVCGKREARKIVSPCGLEDANAFDLLVVLEVQTNTGQVDKWLDAGLAKLLRVTNTRALEDEWGA